MHKSIKYLIPSDAQMAEFWLQASGTNKHTRESYSRELKRLSVWMHVHAPGLTLASMDIDAANQYLNFLADLPDHWIKPRKPVKDQPLADTQLFASKPSDKSIAHARRILVIFFSYLVKSGHVTRNVFELSAKKTVIEDNTISRLINLPAWRWLWKWILDNDRKQASQQSAKRASMSAARVRWLFAFIYHTGLRREEVAKAVMGDIRIRHTDDIQIWELKVIGKGNKVRYVTLNSVLMEELSLYRSYYDLIPYPLPDETYPMIMSLFKNRVDDILTPRMIGMLIKQTIDSAAGECHDPVIKSQIKRISTHWLRHANASHRLMSGASLLTTQDELGHQDLRTTRKYTHTTEKERYLDAEKLTKLTNS